MTKIKKLIKNLEEQHARLNGEHVLNMPIQIHCSFQEVTNNNQDLNDIEFYYIDDWLKENCEKDAAVFRGNHPKLIYMYFDIYNDETGALEFVYTDDKTYKFTEEQMKDFYNEPDVCVRFDHITDFNEEIIIGFEDDSDALNFRMYWDTEMTYHGAIVI